MNPAPRVSLEGLLTALALAAPLLFVAGILLRIMYTRLQAHLRGQTIVRG